MVKLILSGCNGTMGRAISNLIEEKKGIEIIAGLSRNPKKNNNSYPVYTSIFECKEQVDVIIDFSNPQCLPNVIQYAVERNIPLLIATTGLSKKDLEDIKIASKKIPVLCTANTSLGLNLLINLVKKAAVVLEENFDIEIIEKHHNKKIDAPSGSAFMIADEINKELDNSKKYVFGRSGNEEKRAKNEIGIHAIRGGSICGEHNVIFAGLDEIIEIKHTAFSKKVFALGAIKAAKYIVNKDYGLYTMEDLINL
ncbi:4-hydroxy-tetrahydrodipicolinate reductase [Oceanirhabdus sp. W0125-5]|uniref:4-hydroxy-tetrahydrodipicolinate reductase n=1 Tax=Oceanirhabdus sp. W0125-5 TaxID=2999116 RepID=UPI0022F2D5ED|nr:4-hydroxy-tetrahydrodipicolinate reductase [Oceanirhabdus sp. W0125-5]WBW99818.1 4-hydroxy-tetrahydrodipicolinate reductase [Oceanirhabdus sp. W0125-5]